jgi:hypothetical protein
VQPESFICQVQSWICNGRLERGEAKRFGVPIRCPVFGLDFSGMYQTMYSWLVPPSNKARTRILAVSYIHAVLAHETKPVRHLLGTLCTKGHVCRHFHYPYTSSTMSWMPPFLRP